MTNLLPKQKARTREFFKKIYDMPLKGGGVVLCDADFKDTVLKHSIKSMTAQAIKHIAKTGAAYASVNIFKAYPNGYFRRTENFLWRFNHITIDIDYQGDFVHNYQALEDELERNIRWHAESYGIPMPSFIVFSGSGGAHLYYVFEGLPNGSERQMVKGIQATKMNLVSKWVEAEKNLAPYGAGFKVDTNATDASRIFRVPGSIHAATGRMCYMKETGTPRYTYKNLCMLLSDKPWNGDYTIQNANRDIDWVRNGFKKNIVNPIPFSNKYMTEQRLADKRIDEIFRLARQGYGFFQCRETAAHLLWIWVRQAGLSEQDCERTLRELNGYFHAPLSDRELLRVARGRDKDYWYRNQTIRNRLGLSPADSFFVSRRAREFKNRGGNARRHKKLIAELVLLGKKIREIAHELKLSISLVKRRRIEIKRTEGFDHWAAALI